MSGLFCASLAACIPYLGGNFHLKVGGAKSSGNAGDPMLRVAVSGGSKSPKPQGGRWSKFVLLQKDLFFFRISHHFSCFKSISSPNQQMHIISMPEISPPPQSTYVYSDIIILLFF